MRKRFHGTGRFALVPAGALLLLTAPALAQDTVSDSVEQFLADTQKRVDETRIWKFHLVPSLKQSLIYTDNVYLNDDDENNVTLTRVSGPGAIVITDPDRLAQIAANTPEFAE